MDQTTRRAWLLLAAGACLLIAMAGARLWKNTGASPAAVSRSPAPAEEPHGPESHRAAASLPPPATQPSPASPHKTGNHLRLRRPDGTYEVVEETAELLSSLTTEALLKTLRQFESTQKAFRDQFTQTLRQNGPAAAWELLVPYLRTPQQRSNEDKARVYEALHLLADIQRDLGSKPDRAGVYEPIRTSVSAGFVSFLSNPDVHSWTKCIALLYLTGQPVFVSAAGPEKLEIDGLPAYDPEASWEAFVGPDRSSRDARVGSSSSNPGLKDPELLRACFRLVQDPSAPGDVRGLALRALGTCKEVSERFDLLALAGDPSRDVRNAAVELLGIRPEALPQGAFFSLLTARDDPEWKTLVFERLSSAAFSNPQMTSVLMKDLPSQPLDPDEYKEAVYRSTVLHATLEQYSAKRDRALLDLLSRSLSQWAPHEWTGENSPIVVVAGFAAARGLKEFASPLRAALGGIGSAEDQQSVKTALNRLER